MENTTSQEGVALTPEQIQLENIHRMHLIMRDMREIPELPSEVPNPKDTSVLERVEFPAEGGILTWMSGHSEPYKGFPFFEMVEKIDIVKKLTRAVFSSFFHSLKRRNKVQLLFVAFVPWLLMDAAKAGIYTFYRVVQRFRVKPLRYCDSMRELHRAFGVIEFMNEPYGDKEVRLQVRDLMCMIMEFDNAYRYRFQDIIVELDKAAVRRNPGKEINRLLTIMQGREKTQDIRDTWALAKKFLPIFLFFNRKIRRSLVAVLTELDLEKVALSKEDQHYCRPRSDYKFGFTLQENVS